MSNPSFQERIARKFPPDYRQEIIPLIMERIAKGESCFIVGMSGAGKSNLFRCLQNKETKQKYLPGHSENYAFIWADTNALVAELSAFYLYELILYNLQKWAEDNRQPQETIDFMRGLHEKVALSESHILAPRHLETAFRHLFNRLENFHLVLLFDEFEPIIRQLDFQFFKNLRWLRDEFKYHLSYVMAAHRMPTAIREGFFDQGEPFYELLASNILGLKPYNANDTQFMLAELSKRYEVELTPLQNALIAKASGGHGGLITTVFKIMLKHPLPHHEDSQLQQLLSYDAIAGECRKIWNSLEAQEQDVLLQLINYDVRPEAWQPLSSLAAKGVVLKDTTAGQPAIFSPLFQKFLQTFV
ncbi:MAG: AAA family ATPase [Anaerolineae bacterium]|nr:AAA family ATPase [Anaerolineae bacterium]